MNFLLHRHLAVEQLASTAAGVGAMLPDLWRMADPRVRARPLDEALPPAADAITAEVARGVEHHLAVDLWFHAADVFRDGEKRTFATLRDAKFEARRMPLLAHVAWELCLDRALVERSGWGETVLALRESLALTDGATARVAGWYHFDRAGDPERRARFDERMSGIAGALCEGPWIARYRDGAGLAEILGRLRARLGLEPLAVDETRRLAALLDGLHGDAKRALDELFAHVPRLL